ncbi:DUF4012 domain-containing protein [Microbacterium sp. NPDC055357]
MSDSATTPLMRKVGIIFAVTLGAILVLALLAAAWVAVRGATAYAHLRTAQDIAQHARADLADPDAAASLIADLSNQTRQARSLTSDPVWTLAEGLPWVGPQLTAVSAVSRAVDETASTALAPLVDVAAAFSLDTIRPVEGRIDIEGFVQVQRASTAASERMTRAAASVRELDRTGLLAPLREAIDDVGGLLDEASALAGAISRTTTLLPAMLGADGPRDYLVLFQNNAEWRSLGGIPGAMALVHTQDGALELSAQDSAGSFPRYDEPVLPLDAEVAALFGDRPGRWMQNVTQVPDFGVSAALAREMWQRQHGHAVDGVVSVDPVALSYLLEATGPVVLASGDILDAENAVSFLLNDVYLRFPSPSAQDEYFADAAAAVFAAVAGGAAEPRALVEALARGAAERRILLWSAHEAEQALIAETTLAGGLPPTARDAARFGVYLNDATASKMDYYLVADTSVEWASCASGPAGYSGDARLTVMLTNTAPADAGSLPIYITGGAGLDLAPGTARTLVYAYLPRGFELVGAKLSAGGGFGGGMHDGRRVVSFTVDLAPGESTTATVTARSDGRSSDTLAVQSTPTLHVSDAVDAVCGTSTSRG